MQYKTPMRRKSPRWLLIGFALAALGGCKAAARCGLWVLEAWEHDPEFESYKEGQKRQKDLIELNRQIDEADPALPPA